MKVKAPFEVVSDWRSKDLSVEPYGQWHVGALSLRRLVTLGGKLRVAYDYWPVQYLGLMLESLPSHTPTWRKLA